MSSELFNKLRYARVLIPCRKEENGSFQLELVVNAEGEPYIPAFYARTSNLGKFHEGSLLELEFRQLRNIMIELPEKICGIVIEPFGENVLLGRESLMAYDSAVQGMTVARNRHQGGVNLQPARSLPHGLTDALQNFFARQIGVNAAWVLLAQGENERMPHLMFMIDFYGSKFDLFPALAEVVKPYMKPGQQFELIERNPSIPLEKMKEALVYSRNQNVSGFKA